MAITSLDLPARPAHISVLVGGDGAGKSTALRVLVGLIRPHRGAVHRPPKTEIGYVPATVGVYPDLSVEENLAFAAVAFGIRGNDLDRQVRDVAARVGLSQAPRRLGGELSGGMQRKLAIGMALIHAPLLLVLDEPTTGIDPLSRTHLWRLITGAAAAGAAVVVATTYVQEAERGDHAVVLEAGRMLVSGSPSEIISHVPGAVATMPPPTQPTPLSWRRGRQWRVWAPLGELPDAAQRVQPDIEDATVVAALSAEAGSS